jgi:NAD(P)-dependent dehydrogenase (short-subunit alcohol dehydrogenase family)
VLLNYVDPELEGILEERGEAEFRRKVDRRFWSMIHMSRAVVPLMREQGEGRILQVFCQEQAEEGEPCQPFCEAFHGTLEVFNESLALQVAGYGIRVEVLSPEELETVEEALALVR